MGEVHPLSVPVLPTDPVTRVGVQIADPALEIAFRKAQFASNRRKLMATALAMVVFSLAVLLHGLIVGATPTVMAARSANIVLMTMAIGLVWRVRSYKILEWAATVSLLLCSGVFSLMIVFVPSFAHIAGTGIVGIAVLAYLMSPTSSLHTAFAVSLTSLAMFLIWVLSVDVKLESTEVLYVALWTINVNCLGYAGIRSLHYWQRTHFCQNRLLETLSVKDALTGLYNRLYFKTCLDDHWRRSEQDGASLSLIMIDIDHFKRFNDASGHPAGDTCLREVAAVLTKAFERAEDVVVRYGGEEFACILPRTDAVGARAAADRAMAAIDAARIPHPDSPIGPFVTVSMGVGTIVWATANVADLCSLADERLYIAKRNGRNRLESGPRPRPPLTLARVA